MQGLAIILRSLTFTTSEMGRHSVRTGEEAEKPARKLLQKTFNGSLDQHSRVEVVRSGLTLGIFSSYEQWN